MVRNFWHLLLGSSGGAIPAGTYKNKSAVCAGMGNTENNTPSILARYTTSWPHLFSLYLSPRSHCLSPCPAHKTHTFAGAFDSKMLFQYFYILYIFVSNPVNLSLQGRAQIKHLRPSANHVKWKGKFSESLKLLQNKKILFCVSFGWRTEGKALNVLVRTGPLAGVCREIRRLQV